MYCKCEGTYLDLHVVKIPMITKIKISFLQRIKKRQVQSRENQYCILSSSGDLKYE